VKKQIVVPYVVNDPKSGDQRCGGHWVKTLFSTIILTFERQLTNLGGAFVLVPISNHPSGEPKKRRKKTRDGAVGSATWYTTHVCSTVSTTVVSDPLLLC
jgi:hypothetical protein